MYASPNALSAYRRLGLRGDLIGEHLATLTAELLPTGPDPVDDSVQSVLSGRTARRSELVSGEAHLMVRVLPLADGRERVGTVVLCRDVSDLRSKERELVTKDATIREIHHRVKNNLQTVAALLRMQARRIESPEAKVALTDAMSRVASIAIVHETLSQTFDEIVEFDAVADELLQMVGDVSASWGGVSAIREGSFRIVVGRRRDRPGDDHQRALPERRRAWPGTSIRRGARGIQSVRRATSDGDQRRRAGSPVRL